MASVQKHIKSSREITSHRSNNCSKIHRLEGINKQKWVSEHKLVHGSLQEGQGFALKKKEKIKHEYNKLLRKQRKSKRRKSDLEDKYPDHLQHLYLAEEQRQRDALKKRHRWTERTASTGKEEEEDSHEDRPGEVRIISTVAQHGDCSGQIKEVSTQASPVSSPQSNSRKARRKITSYNRTKEDYKKWQEDCERKKEAYLKYTSEREEAIRKYKEKKKATYNLLKKKTKKGQPNLNAHMELLLQKIQCSKQ
ncbi:hypothetical protein ACEWY4_001335 [Coilia grayii]|uniref:Thyroid transcription factor 1-associated protein 26 n=1 Tax=Coilia grayii TaxID=363190 RepID=A0ABD1KSP9_9TELE